MCVDNESSNDTTIATVVVNSSPVKTLLPISSAVTALKNRLIGSFGQRQELTKTQKSFWIVKSGDLSSSMREWGEVE